MRIFLVKAILAMAIINGVSSEAYSAVNSRSIPLMGSPSVMQLDVSAVYGFFKSAYDYLVAPEIELKPASEDDCNPKLIKNKEHWRKCGLK